MEDAGAQAMKTDTDKNRESLLRRNLLLVASYVAVMLLIAGAYS